MRKSGNRNLPVVQEGITDKSAVAIGLGNQTIYAEAVFYVPEVQPQASGPWSAEADKIAWTDDCSGYACIIRRSPYGGHLGGYIAVPPTHPFYGMNTAALIGSGVRVQHRLSYAAKCERGAREEIAICHVSPHDSPLDIGKTVSSNTSRPHDDAWWYGFECDGPADIIPNEGPSYAIEQALDGITERVYRGESYVYAECVDLASQLRAIADGKSPATLRPRGRTNYHPSKAEL